MTKNCSHTCALVLVVALTSCRIVSSSLDAALSGDPSLEDCGFDVLPPPTSPPTDPCAAASGSDVLLEPTAVEREPGPPQTESFSFAAPAEGWVCVSVENDGIAAARIDLDGAPLLGPDRFRPVVHVIDEVAAVAAGDHELTARLASGPANSLAITVRFTPLDPAPQNVVAGAAGRIEAYNLFDVPDPFSPNGDGVKDETSLSVDVRVVRTDGLTPPSSPNTFRLRYALEIASAETCEELRRIEGTVVLDPSTIGTGAGATSHIVAPIAEAWDGRDDAGALVPDGRYFYRYAIDYEKEVSSGNVHLLDSVSTPIADLVLDTTPPEVFVTSPEAGMFRTLDTFVHLSGLVRPAEDVSSATLDITSDAGTRTEALVLDGDAAFDADVDLDILGGPHGDLNELLLTAWDRAGNIGTYSLTVTHLPEYVTNELLVVFTDSVGPPERASIIAGSGATEIFYLHLINGSLVELPTGATVPEAEAHFGALAGVEYTGRNYFLLGFDQVYPWDPVFLDYHDPVFSALDVIGAPLAWERVTGDATGEVIVAVLDTGIDFLHPDLQANIWINPGEDNDDGVFDKDDLDGTDHDGNGYFDDVVGYDFNLDTHDELRDRHHLPHDLPPGDYTDRGEDPIPLDHEYHGTGVAGIIGAVGNNGLGTTGVNWTTKIMALRFSGDVVRLTRAFEYAVDNGARVVNMSFELDRYDSGDLAGFRNAICNAYRDGGPDGVLVVASAGNDGRNVDEHGNAHFPSSFDCPNMIGVAWTRGASLAVTPPGGCYHGSNYGPRSVDVAAPASNRDCCSPFVSPSNITTAPRYRLIRLGGEDWYRFPAANRWLYDCAGNWIGGQRGRCPDGLEFGGVHGHADGFCDLDVPDILADCLYQKLGGTSGAAAIVSGEAALLLATDPDMRLDRLIWIIRAAVDRSSALSEEVETGRVNVAKAVDMALDPRYDVEIEPYFAVPEETFGQEDVVSVAFAPLAVSPTGVLFAVGGEDNEVHLFDPEVTHTLDAPLVSVDLGSDTRAVAFNHSGEWLAAGNDNGEVWVLDVAGLRDGVYDPADLLYVHGTGHKVNDLEFSGATATLDEGDPADPSDDVVDYFLAVATNDQTLIIIDEGSIASGDTATERRRFEAGAGLDHDYEDVSISADAGYVVVGSDTDVFRVYATASFFGYAPIVSSDFGIPFDGDVDAVAYDPTDHGERPRFAVGNDSGDGGYIRMCRASITGNAPADRVLGCSGAHWLPDDAQGVSWAPNASFVVVGTENHVAKALFVNETSPVPGPPWCVVEFWDFFSSGAEIHNTMQTVAVSPAGSFFLVGTDNEAGADWFNLHAYSIDPPQG